MRRNEGRPSFFLRFLPSVPCSVLLFLFFSPVIFSSHQFAFRDGSHFYYPLFRQIQEMWNCGEIPLWDVYENLGQPLLANPTSSVFYPGKLIFFLPCVLPISYGCCFKGYVLSHVLLCYFAFYYFARRRGSLPAATLGAAAYAFGGAILFQHTNVVFLIGAAYLPLIFHWGLKTARTGRWLDAVKTAVFLSLALLGGDPQTAYLAGTSLVVYALFVKRDVTVREILPEETPSSRFSALGALVFAGIFSSALCAVQIVPTVEMLTSSGRVSDEMPRSIWEISRCFDNDAVFGQAVEPTAANRSRWDNLADGIFCRRLESSGHHRSMYAFSLAPWRILEWIWPNLFGVFMPENGRWSATWPADRYLWFSTLYFGLLPFGFSILGARFGRRSTGERGNGERKFFTLLAIFAILGSMGGFGVGWLIRAATNGCAGLGTLRSGDPVGGVYWFLTQILPAFTLFRFPAKLMTFGAMALSTLALFGMDRFVRCPAGRAATNLRVGFGVVALISAIGAAIFFFGGPMSLLAAWTGNFSGTTLFGPCDSELVRRTLILTFLQTAAMGAFLFILLRPSFWTGEKRRRAVQIALIALVCADLFLAQRGTVVTMPETVFEMASPPAERILAEHDSPAPPRVFRDYANYPTSFFLRWSKNRPAEWAAWDAVTLAAKFSASAGIASADVRGTMVSSDYLRLTDWLREGLASYGSANDRPSDGARELALAFLDVGHLILSPRTTPDLSKAVSLAAPNDFTVRWPTDTVLWQLTSRGRRVRILHDDRPRPVKWPEMFAYGEKISAERAGEEAVLTAYQPNRLEVSVVLKTSGSLLLAEQYAPGWKARVFEAVDGAGGENRERRLAAEGDEMNRDQRERSTALGASGENRERRLAAEVRRDFRFLRRVDLPAGRYRVVLEYRPLSFAIGAAVSLASAVFLVLVTAAVGWRRFRGSANRENLR